jgi:predicted Zn-dependent peptidase
MSVKISTLSNGLRVVSDSFNTVDTVSIGVWVDVGTRHETKPLNGISHFLEHMAFKGTSSRSALQISSEIENVGGYLNAYTSRETTAYFARILKEDTSLAVDILSDILQNSIFDPVEFNREQGVIIQEIGQSLDTPDDIVFDYFQETLFPDQPMGWPTLGAIHNIESFKPQDIADYMAQMYSAQNMVLAASGNIDHDILLKLGEHYFGQMRSTPPQMPLGACYEGGDKRIEKDLEQVHILMGFEGIPFTHPDYYAMSILSIILGGGMSSRLFQEIREKRGLVYSIYTYNAHYRDSGVFSLYGGTGPEQVQEFIPAACGVLKEALGHFEEDEIKRAKAQMRASLLMSAESTSGRAERLANQMLIYGKPLEQSEILQKIEAVTAADLNRILEKMMGTIPTLTCLGPVSSVPSYSDLRALLAH